MEQKKIALLNTFFNDLTCLEAVDVIDDLIRKKQKAYVVEVNTDVAVKIEDDPYLLAVVRYIHNNPPKAGIAKREDYPWSSWHDRAC